MGSDSITKIIIEWDAESRRKEKSKEQLMDWIRSMINKCLIVEDIENNCGGGFFFLDEGFYCIIEKS